MSSEYKFKPKITKFPLPYLPSKKTNKSVPRASGIPKDHNITAIQDRSYFEDHDYNS